MTHHETQDHLTSVFAVAIVCAVVTFLTTAKLTLIMFFAQTGVSDIGVLDTPVWFLRLGVPPGSQPVAGAHYLSHLKNIGTAALLVTEALREYGSYTQSQRLWSTKTQGICCSLRHEI
jgi:hypothetical protein